MLLKSNAASPFFSAAALKVVYSPEEPIKSPYFDPESGKNLPGSLSFVPSVMGLIMSGEVIKDLIK